MAYLKQALFQINILNRNCPPTDITRYPTRPFYGDTYPAPSSSDLFPTILVSSILESSTSTTSSVPSRANLQSAKIGKEIV